MLGGCALFAGAGSPVTHLLGGGMDPVTPDEFDAMEQFFFSRGATSVIDLCPMCDLTVLEQVQKRGYRIAEFNNVMVRRLTVADRWLPHPDVETTEDEATWSRVVAAGFSGHDEPPAGMVDIMDGFHDVGTMWVARSGEHVVGGAGAAAAGGVALLFGDATLIRERGRGLQARLIAARLARAAEWGCELAMACVLPGSGSHRNYERAGFSLAYMRVNVSREAGA